METSSLISVSVTLKKNLHDRRRTWQICQKDHACELPDLAVVASSPLHHNDHIFSETLGQITPRMLGDG